MRLSSDVVGEVCTVEVELANVCKEGWVGDVHVVRLDLALEVPHGKSKLVVVHQRDKIHVLV